MAPIRLLNLLAVSSLAVLSCSFGFTQVTALAPAGDSHNVVRHIGRGHDAMAKRRRSTDRAEKRCKARPVTSSGAVAPTTVVSVAPTTAASSSVTASASVTSSAAPGSSTPVYGGSGSAGGGKAGLCWANGEDPALANFKSPKVTRLYTWSVFYPSTAKSLGIEPIPMFWGAKDTNDFIKMVVNGPDDYASTVMGFNEPNQHDQSAMSPQDAAGLWMQYIQPLKQRGYKLVSPATTSAPDGLTWMQDFFSACIGCTFDAVAVHYYDVTAEGFEAYVNLWHDTFKLPIWVTEFACQNFNGGDQCTQDGIFTFMKTVTAFMDSSPFVEAYMAFGTMHDMVNVNPQNQLMNAEGFPTDLGRVYMGI